MTSQAEFARSIYGVRNDRYDDSWHPSFARFMVEHADIRPGDQVLDLACGTGLVTFLAADTAGPFGAVVGVDISSGMLAKAIKKKGPAYPNVQFYEHDVTSLDTLPELKGQTFDVVIMASAFVLLDDPVEAVKHFANFLVPGGRLIIDSTPPSNLPIGTALERTAKRMDIKIGYNRSWSTSEVAFRQTLEAGSLQVDSIISKAQKTNGQKTYNLDDADELFRKQAYGEATALLTAPDVVDEARAIFREELMAMATDGKVIDEDWVWVAIAHKAH